MNEVEIDCRGMLCPRPVIELAKAIQTVPINTVVAIVADDVAAATDIPAWCRMRSQEFLGAALVATAHDTSPSSSPHDDDPAVMIYRIRRIRV